MLQAIRDARVEIVASWELAEELADVLRRPKLRRYGLAEQDVQDALVLLAPFLPSVDVAVELRDADDAPVVAAAVAGAAEVIVTGDGDLLADDALRRWLAERNVQVLTPLELLERLGVGAGSHPARAAPSDRPAASTTSNSSSCDPVPTGA